ncbi:Nitrile hydratase alpha /Thiocyanate hydrolase gamma [Pseudocohnilembus persalinus]|uniref:nitrile hydratase n=1 Tax=Pseudocohnilembus persalinus TaxID=266149 RepID=A0A0V0QW22_PSEPJ|nr:Nitrile hydratase alpha /Thiocyanate hydrolase gamma [Pseudocohnilembus persalinus]|eukprot:KRX06418.1 Nitrile hydratase alpha /Thiocyanate hydrolase gamma [Pseudocohnilembus persalinus]
MYKTHNFGYEHDVGGDIMNLYTEQRKLHEQQQQEPKLKQYLEKQKNLQYWEYKADALVVALSMKGLMNVDQMRCGVENLEGHQGMEYYERWVLSVIRILTNSKVIERKELEQILGINKELYDEKFAEKQLFQAGDIVQVKSEHENIPFRRPHLRTPGYLYGTLGVVVKVVGKFKNPELLAYKEEGPKQYLYTIRFKQKDLWPEYNGSDLDTIDVEIYQHWLQSVNSKKNEEIKKLLQDFQPVDVQEKVQEIQGHQHLPRKIVEANAVLKEGEPQNGEMLCNALCQVLFDKKVLEPQELQKIITKCENLGNKNEGARIVARAWTKPDFKEKLLQNANKALEEEFEEIRGSNPNTPTELIVHENTDNVHNVIVCTLCSCYPKSILGMSPSWYKSRTYRARIVREPRRVLQEFGCHIDQNKQIRVHDSTADTRYMVLPQRPKGTENLSEEELIQMVTRDGMLGVALI